MNPHELALFALAAKAAGTNMTLVVPRPWRDRPAGFPRGELFCEQPGAAVRRYDPDKILKWMEKNGLYETTPWRRRA